MTIEKFKFFTDGLKPEERLRHEYMANTRIDDERYWIPYGEGTWFQACYFNVTTGGFANVLKILPGRQLDTHYHISTVHGFTLRGKWGYREHDWIATPGSYIFEPPGELHTLYVPEDSPEPMITFFVLSGGLIYTKSDGSFAGYDDGFTLLELAREHYLEVGLDESLIDAMIR
ncbi:MAG: 2,4'-dihydroxyacetophenone dioxygenase family protein [Calothrix sp. MO_167.B42]|nr:2,4'-dihydroxyacetophenone dioxygenase family protein [Calothrix sp. MO_167.B42]